VYVIILKTKGYLSLICTCAVSRFISSSPAALSLASDDRFLLDASNTPESPATDSSLTAADTDLVFVPDDDGVDNAATCNNYYSLHTYPCFKVKWSESIFGLQKAVVQAVSM
jgi:hypothetical protein